jgi:hypothetical protein
MRCKKLRWRCELFDIEKAKSRGLKPKQIEIMQKINENSLKRDNCKKHDFVDGSRFGKYRCKNCGCEEEAKFVLGYKQGLKHAGEN